MRDINLLPEDVKGNPKEPRENVKEGPDAPVAPKEAEAEKKSSKAKGILIAAAAAAVIGVTLAAPRIYLGQLDNVTAGLEKSISDPKYNETIQMNRKMAEIDRILGTKKSILHDIDKMSYPVTEVFTSLRNACPKGCYITDIDYNGGQIRVGGIAANTLYAAEFMSNLDSLEHLSRDTSSENLQARKTNTSTDFNFTYNIGGGGK